MKKVIYIQAVALLFEIFVILTYILKLSDSLSIIIVSTAILLQTISLIYSIQQKKLVDFMEAETKRGRDKPFTLSVSYASEDNGWKSNQKEKLSGWHPEEQDKLELLRKRLELSVLQNQINPHFLYNTLDSIRSQALMNGQTEIAAMTERLSRFFRYCISNQEGLVKIQEELNHVYDYYFIQKYRFEDRFDMEIKTEDESIYDLYITKMTLQPLLENAISHGLERIISRKGLVTINLFMTDNKVIIKVSDNGIGMKSEQLNKLNERLKNQQIKVSSEKSKHNGIALMNVNSRIKITFGDEYGIHYRSKENAGTVAEVTLPIIDEFQRAKVARRTFQ